MFTEKCLEYTVNGDAPLSLNICTKQNSQYFYLDHQFHLKAIHPNSRYCVQNDQNQLKIDQFNPNTTKWTYSDKMVRTESNLCLTVAEEYVNCTDCKIMVPVTLRPCSQIDNMQHFWQKLTMRVKREFSHDNIKTPDEQQTDLLLVEHHQFIEGQTTEEANLLASEIRRLYCEISTQKRYQVDF